MHVFSQSENRIKLESDTHLAVVSRDWNGEETANWLLTAYEKKESGSSVGSMDIGTEPEGKQNGTAPLQTSSFNDKGSNSIANEQEMEDEKSESVGQKNEKTKMHHLLITTLMDLR